MASQLVLRLLAFALLGVLLGFVHVLRAEVPCMYLNHHGEIVSIRSKQHAPAEFRDRVVCEGKEPTGIAAPEDLKLGSDTRIASFSTEVGLMKVRWSRAIEGCFGASPSRAVSEAAQAFTKALRTSRFSVEVKYARREWSLVFIDKTRAFSQFPIALSLGAHPGFMVPPSQIYIISDYVATDCSRKPVSDEILIQVLLHEMGHVLEYLLLGESDVTFDRVRAEGFASWFEQYSSDFATSVTAGRVRRESKALARQTSSLDSRGFLGTAGDYARAALPFEAIVERKGVSGLMKVYRGMREEKLSFHEAVKRGIGWDRAMLERQIQEQLER